MSSPGPGFAAIAAASLCGIVRGSKVSDPGTEGLEGRLRLGSELLGLVGEVMIGRVVTGRV